MTGMEWGVGVQFYLCIISAIDEGRWSHHALAALSLGKSPGIHGTGGWWASGPVWTNIQRKFLLPPGFEPKIMQPVASCCVDCAILASPKYLGYAYFN